MLLPLALNVQDVPCLVVGGGEVASRKVRSLLECGARVKVVAPHLCETLQEIRGHYEYSEREFERGDCKGMRLIFACTDARKVNDFVAQCAREQGTVVNVADDGQSSDFTNMASVRRGEITIAISTGGGSPALSKHLSKTIENVVGDEYAQLLEIMSENRARQNRQETTQSQRAAKWHRVLESDVLDLLRRGETEVAKARVNELLNEVS